MNEYMIIKKLSKVIIILIIKFISSYECGMFIKRKKQDKSYLIDNFFYN